MRIVWNLSYILKSQICIFIVCTTIQWRTDFENLFIDNWLWFINNCLWFIENWLWFMNNCLWFIDNWLRFMNNWLRFMNNWLWFIDNWLWFIDNWLWFMNNCLRESVYRYHSQKNVTLDKDYVTFASESPHQNLFELSRTCSKDSCVFIVYTHFVHLCICV